MSPLFNKQPMKKIQEQTNIWSEDTEDEIAYMTKKWTTSRHISPGNSL